MTDTAIPMTNAQRDAAARDAEVSAANIKLEQLKAAYADSPEMRLELNKLALEKMRNDPYHLGRALVDEGVRNEEAMLIARIRDAETQAAAIRLGPDEAARQGIAVGHVDPATDPYAGEVTYEGMLPARDHAAAVADLLDTGARPGLIETFLKTGRGDDPAGRDSEIAAARAWRRKLDSDPEMQRRLLAGDAELRKQLVCYSMYAERPHEV